MKYLVFKELNINKKGIQKESIAVIHLKKHQFHDGDLKRTFSYNIPPFFSLYERIIGKSINKL